MRTVLLEDAAATLSIFTSNFAFPVIQSRAIAADAVLAIDAAALVSGFDPVPEIDNSTDAVLHLEDTNPAQIGTVGTEEGPANVVAAPSVSLFQTRHGGRPFDPERTLDAARAADFLDFKRGDMVRRATTADLERLAIGMGAALATIEKQERARVAVELAVRNVRIVALEERAGIAPLGKQFPAFRVRVREKARQGAA